jgi:methylmalonyl-CoA mutase N-terminal domain/subunit
MGGMVAAIERGWVQQQIEQSAYDFGQSLENGEQVIVGVNKYQISDETAPELFQPSAETGARQIEELRVIKSQRDPVRVEQALNELQRAAVGNDNLMPFIIEAVKAYASIGEICAILQSEFGEYVSPY